MRLRNRLVVVLVTALILLSLLKSVTISAELPSTRPGNQAMDDGSSEAVKDQPRQMFDDQTSQAILVFESVANDQRINNNDFAGLRFYLAPSCLIDLPTKPVTVERSNGDKQYVVNFSIFRDGVRKQVADNLTTTLATLIHGNKIEESNVYNLTYQQIRSRLNDFPTAIILPYGN